MSPSLSNANRVSNSLLILKNNDLFLLTGNNLLGILGPLLVTICQNQTKYTSPELRTAATMALSKFMMVR